MQLIKSLLLVVLVLSVIAGVGYVGRRYIHLPPGAMTALEGATKIPQLAIGTGRSVISQAVPAVQQSGEVLGAQINIKKSDQSLPERAFEYGRYQYCVQVVKDYEERQSAASSSSSLRP